MKIFVGVKTKSEKPGIKKVDNSHFVVSVAEPPIDGKANAAVARALAEYFDVAISRVLLVSGASSKRKVFEII